MIKNSQFINLALILQILLPLSHCSDAPRDLTKEELKQLDTASHLYSERKFDEAREILLPLVTSSDGSVEPAVLLAKVQFFTRDFDQSESTLRSLLKKRKSPYALLWLGRVIASDPERREEAADIFRSLLRDDPENHAAHYYLGRCLESQGKMQEALLSYQRALAVEYPLSKMHLHIGTVLEGLRMKDRAAIHFKRVRQLNVYPDDILWIDEQTPDSKKRKSDGE